MEHLMVWHWFKHFLLDEDERRTSLQSFEALSREQFADMLMQTPGASSFPPSVRDHTKQFMNEVTFSLQAVLSFASRELASVAL